MKVEDGIFGEIGLNKFNTDNIIEEVQEYTESNSQKAFVIFACDARVLWMYKNKDSFIYNSYETADRILPDGRPIYWLLKKKYSSPEVQITGPGIMRSVLAHEVLKKKRHMFYGGSPEVIQRIKARALKEGVNVVYAESPPYLPIEDLDISRLNYLIKDYECDFLWCGLGAPKQEHMIFELDRSQKVVMLGVGLAFDLYANTVFEAPRIFSILGLSWFFRYAQQPRRFGRFVRPFIFVISLMFQEMLRLKPRGS